MTAKFKTFAENTVGYASEINDYLMRQATIVCNDATDRNSIPAPTEGLRVYRKDTKATEIYDGSTWLTFDSIWQTYTPVIYTNNVAETLGNGTSSGKYFRTGKKCDFKFRHVIGSSTNWNASGFQEVTLPVSAAYSSGIDAGTPMGVAQIEKSGSGTCNVILQTITSGTRAALLYDQFGNAAQWKQAVTSVSPGTWSTGNVHQGSGTYETA